jgi:hypothetical protein
MGELEDPTGGWAKALEEGAKASAKAVDASRDLGGFISGPAREIIGMVEDRLKVARFERQVRLLERVDTFLRAKGLKQPTRQLSLNIGLPLLTHAAIEEDDELQDQWVALLANAADADNNIEIRRAYVSMLADMTSLDVRVLKAIEAAFNEEKRQVLTYGLPEFVELEPNTGANTHVIPADPSPEVAISLGNLARLGCISLATLWEGGVSHRYAGVTPLGIAFVTACSEPKIDQRS